MKLILNLVLCTLIGIQLAACASVPASDPLPAGIVNGDIVFGDDLYWFIWNDHRHRIWMPATLVEEISSMYKFGTDQTRKLIGANAVDVDQAIFTSPGNEGLDKVYLVDHSRKMIYPIQVVFVSSEQLRQIPDSVDQAYYPIIP